MKLLCICHANICRSFMAQEFLKQLLPQVDVFSRGLYADPTYQVPYKVLQALQAHQINVTGHTATLLSPQDLEQADIVFCMEKAHEELLLDRYAQYTDKIWLLTEFAFGEEKDIIDPITLEGKAFNKQVNFLYTVCQAVAKRLNQDFNPKKNSTIV